MPNGLVSIGKKRVKTLLLFFWRAGKNGTQIAADDSPGKRQLFGIQLDWTKRENPGGKKSDYDEKTEIADELTKQYGSQNANVYIN
jgi:hypothetical protein